MPKTKSPVPPASTKPIVPYNHFGVCRPPPPPPLGSGPGREQPPCVYVYERKGTQRCRRGEKWVGSILFLVFLVVDHCWGLGGLGGGGGRHVRAPMRCLCARLTGSRGRGTARGSGSRRERLGWCSRRCTQGVPGLGTHRVCLSQARERGGVAGEGREGGLRSGGGGVQTCREEETGEAGEGQQEDRGGRGFQSRPNTRSNTYYPPC